MMETKYGVHMLYDVYLRYDLNFDLIYCMLRIHKAVHYVFQQCASFTAPVMIYRWGCIRDVHSQEN